MSLLTKLHLNMFLYYTRATNDEAGKEDESRLL